MKAELARAFDLGAENEFDLRLVNVSENETYRIDCKDGRRFALRLNRPGYHTHAEIESEMAWLDTLHTEQVIAAARPITGRNGKHLQTLGAREGVVFHWQDGHEPLISDNLLDFVLGKPSVFSQRSSADCSAGSAGFIRLAASTPSMP